jgi:hypothetical protein
MITAQSVFIERTDAVQFSDPSASSSAGCLKVRNAHGGDLYLFLPDDPNDGLCFLTALIEQATELRASVTALRDAKLAAA